MANFPLYTPESENVTRIMQDTNYNANMLGDEVTDTPAAFPEPVLCISTSGNIDILEYVYSEEVVDPVGVLYENILTNNIMDNDQRSAYFSFKDSFTPGQVDRMRAFIETDPQVQAALTDVASLYEPYKGLYYFAGPELPQFSQPHLQPGFDYTFVSCCCNYLEPSPYDDISFTVTSYYEDYRHTSLETGPIIHRNHYAIIIDQIDPNQARRCQDNINRTPVGGTVTRFNDGTFTHNITVTPKDSTEINTPDLIPTLEPGLYKIEKQLNGGYIEEEVLIKNNH